MADLRKDRTKMCTVYRLRVFVIIPFVHLAGCVGLVPTSPVQITDAKPVPGDRVYISQAESNPELGAIVVTRDAGITGSACFLALYINGNLSARFGPSESATFHVPPGDLLLRVGRDPEGKFLCGLGQKYWTQRESSIASGEKKYFRLLQDSSGNVDIQRSEL